MTQYIYMNEQIREETPERPVIVVQSDSRTGLPAVREANLFDLWHDGVFIGSVKFSFEGLSACKTHDVKAWVEVSDDVVISTRDATSSKPALPVASAKLPNTPIDFKLNFRKA